MLVLSQALSFSCHHICPILKPYTGYLSTIVWCSSKRTHGVLDYSLLTFTPSSHSALLPKTVSESNLVEISPQSGGFECKNYFPLRLLRVILKCGSTSMAIIKKLSKSCFYLIELGLLLFQISHQDNISPFVSVASINASIFYVFPASSDLTNTNRYTNLRLARAGSPNIQSSAELGVGPPLLDYMNIPYSKRQISHQIPPHLEERPRMSLNTILTDHVRPNLTCFTKCQHISWSFSVFMAPLVRLMDQFITSLSLTLRRALTEVREIIGHCGELSESDAPEWPPPGTPPLRLQGSLIVRLSLPFYFSNFIFPKFLLETRVFLREFPHHFESQIVTGIYRASLTGHAGKISCVDIRFSLPLMHEDPSSPQLVASSQFDFLRIDKIDVKLSQCATFPLSPIKMEVEDLMAFHLLPAIKPYSGCHVFSRKNKLQPGKSDVPAAASPPLKDEWLGTMRMRMWMGQPLNHDIRGYSIFDQASLSVSCFFRVPPVDAYGNTRLLLLWSPNRQNVHVSFSSLILI
ncbi:uncharacterized protein BDR25DRAFT_361087 [Lindgomyces ingoldianus]|uniref:Uncharacterized protein n=1 Tax=Lindgomyces ingoldianus TaxID=673940 RepID=A0ACB6QE25_9PLEO|nr:uncharacterized protein BDR25DRAFT_361087 [Lindgomyces ingoldianus]KAF2464858.1 hypothetical protein BDR25DRAFT_361087 [Lindgomyces ingoldianus]